jgi:hypothetical protein
MLRMFLIAMSAVLSLFAAGVAAAEEAGRAQLNGRAIILQTDGTWKYAEDAAPAGNADCSDGKVIKSKKLNLAVCVFAPWKIDTTPNESMEFQLLEPDQDIFVGFVTERTAMPLEVLREAIISNAAKATGIRQEDVPVVSESKVMLNGKEWSYIEFDVDFKGAKFGFGTYYFSLGELGAAQMVFWTSKPYFTKSKPLMDAMASKVKISTDPL